MTDPTAADESSAARDPSADAFAAPGHKKPARTGRPMTSSRMAKSVSVARPFTLLGLTVVGLVAGLALTWAGREDLAIWAWTVPTVLVGARLLFSIVRDLLAREAGVDVIAILAIGGALVLGETFAAALIAVMLATGEALETYAEGRARRELTGLLGRAPQDVHRYVAMGLETVPIATVQPGDRLLVRPGEVVPVDGLVRGAPAVLDESALTGESRLVKPRRSRSWPASRGQPDGGSSSRVAGHWRRDGPRRGPAARGGPGAGVPAHVLASAIVHAARKRGLVLPIPTDVVETPGAGVTGSVDGRSVAVGSAGFVVGDDGLPRWARELRRRNTLEGATNVFIRVDGRLAGALVLHDPIRPETPRAVRSLRRAGFTRIVMVTGDHHSVAELVGAAVGLDGVLADRAPADKVDAVRSERDIAGGPLVMVGDGINDAPALAAADVGVAMGARGATASSEAADIVITVDRLDRLEDRNDLQRALYGLDAILRLDMAQEEELYASIDAEASSALVPRPA